LSISHVASEDIDKYLGIIEERTRCGQTGSRWVMKSLSHSGNSASKDIDRGKLTGAMLRNQRENNPVHRWPIIENVESEEWEHGYRTVGQFMSIDLFTVKPDDLIDLAASVMDWRHIRHVPVEDAEGGLVGLVTHRALLRMISNRSQPTTADPITVGQIMVKNPITVSPETSSLAAIELMRTNRIGCLPVVESGQLVGIVTSFDFLEASAKLFQQHLANDKSRKASAS
jgi:CBS domain-containing protein